MLFRVLLVIWFSVMSFNLQASPPRHALVIGNATYPIGMLSNPVNDASLMKETLEALGFTVTQALNLGRQQFFEEVRAFADKLPSGAMAVVYYAGHGMQVQGANYLIPTDMVPTSEQGVAIRAFPVKVLLEKLSGAASAINVVILDACRNNPFLPQRESRYRSFDGLGLSKIKSPRGTLVAYSTAPGQLAEDGRGRPHSFYTEALAKAITQPGKSLEKIFKEVAESVRRKTLDDQQPWFETSLNEDLYFIPPGGAPATVRIQKKMRGIGDAMPQTEAAEATPDTWFMKLSPREWTEAEADIHERARLLNDEALPLLTHRAAGGNFVAQTTLALAYLHPSGNLGSAGGARQSDQALGVQWLLRAAEQGFPMAQALLGEMYMRGQGVPQNSAAAAQWLERAAQANYGRPRASLLKLKTPAG